MSAKKLRTYNYSIFYGKNGVYRTQESIIEINEDIHYEPNENMSDGHKTVLDATGKRISSETYCGSLSYAAPEILKGNPYHPRIADIWSLGIILYVMLNKAMPFDDTNIKRLYEQQTNQRWKFRAKVADILSDQVKKLIHYILEPDVTKRYRIEQVLSSDWIAMDPRLAELTSAEQAAMVEAQQGKRRHLEGNARTASRRTTNEDMTILKDGKTESKEDKIMINNSTLSLIV